MFVAYQLEAKLVFGVRRKVDETRFQDSQYKILYWRKTPCSTPFANDCTFNIHNVTIAFCTLHWKALDVIDTVSPIKFVR